MQQEDYHKRLHDIALDKSNFSKVKGILSGQNLLQYIANDFFIPYEIHHLFVRKPTFGKNNEVDEANRKVTNFSCPHHDQLDKFLELIN